VSASGRVEAGKEIAVYTEGSQRVEEIFVREGQVVEEGEVLFQISLSELEEQITVARQDMEKARLQNQDIQNSRNQDQQNQETARNRAAEDYDTAVFKGEQSIAEAKSAWDAAEVALREFLESSTDKMSYSQNGEASGESGQLGQIDDSAGSEEAGAEWERRKSELEQAVTDAKRTYEEAVSSKDYSVQEAKRALEDASKGVTLDSTLEQNEITRQQEEIELNKLLELQAAEGKIKAPVRGAVTEIMIAVGDFTSDGTAIRMADASGESYLTVSVDRTEGEFISIGSSVEIKVSGKAEKITDYTVTGIVENKEDKSLLDVRIDLPEGILETGALVEAEIIRKPENYAATLPVEALHEESSGYYVLVLEEEQGVLGTELAVRRLDVEVLDKNGAAAALEGIPYIIRRVIPGEKKIAVFSAGGMIDQASGVQGGLNPEKRQEEQKQENHSCLSRITVLKPEGTSMNDLKSALSSQYGVTAELLDLQLLRGVGGFFVLLVPVIVCVFVLWYFYWRYKKQQEWVWKALMAAAGLILLLLSLFLIKQWVQIPYDYIPEKWSDFTFWTELWKEKADGMECLIKNQKSILDLEWMNSLFKSIILGVLAGVFFVAGIILLNHNEYNVD